MHQENSLLIGKTAIFKAFKNMADTSGHTTISHDPLRLPGRGCVQKSLKITEKPGGTKIRMGVFSDLVGKDAWMRLPRQAAKTHRCVSRRLRVK